MTSELSGARGRDHAVEADGAAAEGRRGAMDAARVRAENDAYDRRHAELVKGQAEANRIAGMFSPIGHVPLTQEARDIVAREAAAKEAAGKEAAGKEGTAKEATAKEGTAKEGTGKEGTAKEGTGKEGTGKGAGAGDAARQDHRPDAAQAQGPGQDGRHRASEDRGDRPQSGQPGRDLDAPGSREERTDREASLEERMAKLVDDRVKAATEGLKTEYEAKLEAMRAELEQADTKRKAELDEVHADLDSMKVVSQLAAEKLQAEREAHRKQLDSLQAEHQKDIDSLKEELKALEGSKAPQERTDETRDPDSDSATIADRIGTCQENDPKNAEVTEGSRWRRALSSENVGLVGTLVGAAGTVTEFAGHVTPDGIIGLGAMVLGLAALGLGKAEKHWKGKKKE